MAEGAGPVAVPGAHLQLGGHHATDAGGGTPLPDGGPQLEGRHEAHCPGPQGELVVSCVDIDTEVCLTWQDGLASILYGKTGWHPSLYGKTGWHPSCMASILYGKMGWYPSCMARQADIHFVWQDRLQLVWLDVLEISCMVRYL